ncbi:MAG: TspO/MBR family protein [Bryobacteraceae bacterium]
MGGLLDVLARPSERRWLALAGFLLATFLTGGISFLFTTPAIPGWYATLAKPSFTPPAAIFAPVWTLLYFLMAIAAWRVWVRPSSTIRSTALMLFWIQLVINFAWSPIFFWQRMIGLALVVIVALWFAIVLTCLQFFRACRVAGSLFVPYLAWVSFAVILNLEIWRLN